MNTNLQELEKIIDQFHRTDLTREELIAKYFSHGDFCVNTDSEEIGKSYGLDQLNFWIEFEQIESDDLCMDILFLEGNKLINIMDKPN